MLRKYFWIHLNKDIYKKFKFPKKMIMTMHEKMVYDNFTLCHICNEELGEDRACDHCHLSRKFRGAAHELMKSATYSTRY